MRFFLQKFLSVTPVVQTLTPNHIRKLHLKSNKDNLKL